MYLQIRPNKIFVPFVRDCAGEICGLVLEINCLTFSIDWGVADIDVDALDLDNDFLCGTGVCKILSAPAPEILDVLKKKNLYKNRINIYYIHVFYTSKKCSYLDLSFNFQWWSWLENELKSMKNTIYTIFKMVIIYLFWLCPSTFGKKFSEENCWNQLNKMLHATSC